MSTHTNLIEEYEAELAALREELATAKRNEHNSEVAYKAAIEKQEELRKDLDWNRLCRSTSEGEWMEALTAAEQRNAELEQDLAEAAEDNKDLGAECTRTHKLLITAELRNEISLGLLSRALKVIQGMRYEKLEAEIVEALNLKPTESGASECSACDGLGKRKELNP